MKVNHGTIANAQKHRQGGVQFENLQRNERERAKQKFELDVNTRQAHLTLNILSIQTVCAMGPRGQYGAAPQPEDANSWWALILACVSTRWEEGGAAAHLVGERAVSGKRDAGPLTRTQAGIITSGHR